MSKEACYVGLTLTQKEIRIVDIVAKHLFDNGDFTFLNNSAAIRLLIRRGYESLKRKELKNG